MTRSVTVARDTDADSFETFYRLEYRPVLGLAITLTHDRFAAEDLTQEAFLAAERDWARIGDLDRPGAWVRRVVANKAVSRWRRLVAETRALRRLGAPRNPQSNQEISSEAAEVWAAVRLLRTRQAQVLALTYLEGLSTKKVGEITWVFGADRKDPSATGQVDVGASPRSRGGNMTSVEDRLRQAASEVRDLA